MNVAVEQSDWMGTEELRSSSSTRIDAEIGAEVEEELRVKIGGPMVERG